MPTYCLTVSYDGTDFVGWQRQNNGVAVQEVLETALERLFQHPVACRGAGRTDAGVHASGQVVTFRSERLLPDKALVFGTNSYLPQSIAVMAARIVPDDFDARFSASGKLYRYHVWNGPVRSPLHDRTHWYVARPLDVAAMRAAAQHLVGRHDFRGFRAADCERKSTVRLIRRVEIVHPDPSGDPSQPTLAIEVEATAFLKNMVRIISGTLVQVGKGKMTPGDVAALLVSGDRTKAGPTAPPHGLRLCRVDYGPREKLE
jgi:tRNA pseudouridine38-40 synthase